MSVIEKQTTTRYIASFFESITTSGATQGPWIEVPFIDSYGNPFECRHIKLANAGADPFLYSFDPRAVSDAERAIHGIVDDVSGPTVHVMDILDKPATSIFVRKSSNTNTTIRIYSWR